MTDLKEQPGALKDAGRIIEKFGGIRPMASKMDVPVTTVQGWKKRDIIPENRRADVLRVAQTNNIDLTDILGEKPANENAGSAPASFQAEIAQAAQREQWPATAVPPPASTIAGQSADHQALMKKIKEAERNAVQKSTWISTALTMTTIGLAVLLLWPHQRQVAENGRRLAELETSLTAVEREQQQEGRAVSATLPAHIQETIETLQTKVGEVAQQAENMAGTLVGPQAGPLTERIAKLESQVGALAGSTGLRALFEKITAMQQSESGQQEFSGIVAQLKSLTGAAQDETQVEDALKTAQQDDKTTLGQALQGLPETDLKAAALLLGLAQFRSSLNRNAPFSDDLALLKKVSGNNDPELIAALDRLAPLSEKGVLTPEGLSGEFRGLAGEIVASSLQGEDVSIKEKAMARLSEVLEVEKDGKSLISTDTQAAVERAQAFLDKGDVEGAMTELSALQGPAAKTAAPWMEQADMTVGVQKLQEMLTERMRGLGGASYTTQGGTLGDLANEAARLLPQGNLSQDSASGVSIYTPPAKFHAPSIPSSSP